MTEMSRAMRANKATDELRAKAARELRYKKPILERLNYEAITSELWDIQSKCDELVTSLPPRAWLE